MTRSSLVAAAMMAVLAAPTTARLAPTETRVAAAIDADQERAVALLEKLVNQNSGTRNIDGVTKVGAMMRAELEALGFKVEWKPMDAVGRAGHIIARHEGRKGSKRMLLIGHLDTVFEPASGFLKFERQGDTAKGPGVGDDKGGMVVMVAALRAMKSAGTLKDANIEIVLTGDEEDSGSPHAIGRADLIAAGKRADIALDFEGLVVIDGQDHGSIARRSSTSYVIRATGKTGHSSGIFSTGMGDGAVFELARILHAFRTELPEPNLTFNIGLVTAGATAALGADEASGSATGKTNIIPPIAIAAGEFRALSPEQIARVKSKMTAIIAKNAPQTSATISFSEGYPAMAPTPGNRALLDRLNGINRDLGLAEMPALDPLRRGAGDISFVAQDVDGLAGLGTDSSGDHTLAESVDLRSINRQAKRAALLMMRLSREPSRK